VSGLGVELAALAVFAGYAVGGLAAVAVLALLLVPAFPRLLHAHPTGPPPGA
jgi:hypothetical protein